MKNSNQTIAIYPGTFDPITCGHTDIIVRSAKIFHTIIVGVASEGGKKNVLFSVTERVNFIANEIERLQLPNVIVKPFEGLLVDFARSENAHTIIRGLRAFSDFEYEFQLSYINRKLCADLETILLPATANCHFISSSWVKEIARFHGQDLSHFVSDEVAKALKSAFKSD
ncbi:pantetheine-phosphate adenylyltransferase [Rickettsiales endosymbiont of Peranema trichophorum]|uniref:pantetheine-phosphate adenylyltransferase n=1 Tax=Rickettsiales endosymbiont of Peranema trichophorum TaxID=2486577 RepID=UPI001023A340|nr:pantetheine-phosphate adenylyltransferase [Rickettsiales endosymbiont of Peranema trichophorum]RZI47674.1 pantetheine-phosphate adenylyltransferase [Rickettsiales endosymbiont of Peranema trichophorum]